MCLKCQNLITVLYIVAYVAVSRSTFHLEGQRKLTDPSVMIATVLAGTQTGALHQAAHKCNTVYVS
jgi:hypothetical protein